MIDRNETECEQAESFPLAEMMKNRFRAVVREALYEVVQSELRRLCGPLHHPDAQTVYRRAGSAASTVFLDGRREALKRPRVRRRAGGREVEVELESWKAAQDPAQWE